MARVSYLGCGGIDLPSRTNCFTFPSNRPTVFGKGDRGILPKVNWLSVVGDRYIIPLFGEFLFVILFLRAAKYTGRKHDEHCNAATDSEFEHWITLWFARQQP